jgi:hypothetical protein
LGVLQNRAIISLQVPEPTATIQHNDKTLYINSVTDNRIFQKNPRSPNIPSLGFTAKEEEAIKSIQKRAIARKRNSFGKALGDILLEENQTVELVVRKLLIKSFTELGYDIIDNQEDLKDNTIVIDTSIEKFWSWMNMGFKISLTTEIETKITITKPLNDTKDIYVKYSDSYFAASGSNWLEVMKKCMQKYTERVKEDFRTIEP